MNRLNLDGAINFINRILVTHRERSKPLDEMELAIFKAVWNEKTYTEIAEEDHFNERTLRNKASDLWRDLTTIFQCERITKNNFKQVVKREWRRQRSPEQICENYLKNPYCLLKISGDRYTGKTRLISNIIHNIQEKIPDDFLFVRCQFSLVENNNIILDSLENFYRFLGDYISKNLHLRYRINNFWSSSNTDNSNLTNYINKILEESDKPVVLILEDLDLVFERSEIANNFCQLIRSWHHKATSGDNSSENWQKLRIVLVYQDLCLNFDINSSPLANTGKLITLKDFTKEQVLQLSEKYNLDLSEENINQIWEYLGGIPLLTDLALRHIADDYVSVDEVLKYGDTNSGIFIEHLNSKLNRLKKNQELSEGLKTLINSTDSVHLTQEIKFQLHNMGLIKLKGDRSYIRCKLYNSFFAKHL